MKKESQINYFIWLVINLAWSLLFGFVLVDYFLPNIPQGVHYVAIFFIASIYGTLSLTTKFIIKKYKVEYVES